MFSHLAYIMAEFEDELLMKTTEHLKNTVGVSPICLIYDGAIVECRGKE